MLFFVQGCDGLVVKSTGGVEAYIGDALKASRAALVLQERFPNEQSKEYKEARRKYDDAATAANAWLAGLTARAKLKRKFDVPVRTYEDNEAYRKLQEFLDYSSSLLWPGTLTKGRSARIEASQAIAAILKLIWESHNEAVEAAIQEVEETLTACRLPMYADLSGDDPWPNFVRAE